MERRENSLITRLTACAIVPHILPGPLPDHFKQAPLALYLCLLDDLDNIPNPIDVEIDSGGAFSPPVLSILLGLGITCEQLANYQVLRRLSNPGKEALHVRCCRQSGTASLQVRHEDGSERPSWSYEARKSFMPVEGFETAPHVAIGAERSYISKLYAEDAARRQEVQDSLLCIAATPPTDERSYTPSRHTNHTREDTDPAPIISFPPDVPVPSVYSSIVVPPSSEREMAGANMRAIFGKALVRRCNSRDSQGDTVQGHDALATLPSHSRTTSRSSAPDLSDATSTLDGSPTSPLRDVPPPVQTSSDTSSKTEQGQVAGTLEQCPWICDEYGRAIAPRYPEGSNLALQHQQRPVPEFYSLPVQALYPPAGPKREDQRTKEKLDEEYARQRLEMAHPSGPRQLGRQQYKHAWVRDVYGLWVPRGPY